MIDLANTMIRTGITKVTLERFEMINRHAHIIQQLPGDIVECGVWLGGMGIFLSKQFSDKRIWLADSFKGFADPATVQYQFKGERHVTGRMAVSYEAVIENFHQYECDNIEVLAGFVSDTLPKADIDQISLLRVDVDAYSATREVLDYLYFKVVAGGYIIFDDTCLIETRAAILDFFNLHGIELKLRHPVTDQFINFNNASQNLPCGCYIIKD